VWLAVAYVAAVLTIDTLVAQNVRVPFPWSHLRWHASCGADLTKFVLWFVAPFLLCLRGMDWGYLGVKRWRRVDFVILGLLACVGMGAVLSTLAFPSLHATYPGLGKAPAAVKMALSDAGRRMDSLLAHRLGVSASLLSAHAADVHVAEIRLAV
jgi:hypothetical protein